MAWNSLSTCEDHDSVVVYTGSKCPVCELIDEQKEKIVELEKAYEDARTEYEERIEELEAEIERLNEPFRSCVREALTNG